MAAHSILMRFVDNLPFTKISVRCPFTYVKEQINPDSGQRNQGVVSEADVQYCDATVCLILNRLSSKRYVLMPSV